jgi:hypothetical protein
MKFGGEMKFGENNLKITVYNKNCQQFSLLEIISYMYMYTLTKVFWSQNKLIQQID